MTLRPDDVVWSGQSGEPRHQRGFGVADVKGTGNRRDVGREPSSGFGVPHASDSRLQLLKSLRFVPGAGKAIVPWLVLVDVNVNVYCRGFHRTIRLVFSVLSSQKVLSGSVRATRRLSMYFPIRRNLPARPEPDNTFWDDSTTGCGLVSALLICYHSQCVNLRY